MKEDGLTFLEILIVIFIFSLFLIPVTIFIQKYHSSYLLNSAIAKIIEGINLARECAINERKNFSIVFEKDNFKIMKENNAILFKEIKLPDNILIEEKSEGFSPLVLLPDGTTKEAGYLILFDKITKKKKKLKIHNITGKCIVEE
ncbi:MAG: hypothetical protein NC926_02905 [Candidatus Omnitrophica bacterium]|nr:hypothetical protein [Candidatus Omnitrophota bacterium]MCM8806896.1 hypothetical protein [Candidatus Omnitrophota bacterium]